MASLKYEGLAINPGEFRVLQTHPAQDSDSLITCSLEVKSLAPKPHFEALSYAWGDQTTKVAIVVNGSQFEVSTNLHQAMKTLRCADEPRTMWIDAICIDQNSTDDKNMQVRVMGNIYQSAKRVVVWLGVDAAGARLAASMIHFWAHRSQPKIPYLDLFDDEFDINAWREIRMIFQSTWWSRMWTFQELFLATQVTFMFGDLGIHDSVLFIASKAWLERHDDMPMQSDWTRLLQLQDGLAELRYLNMSYQRLSQLSDRQDKISDLHGLQVMTRSRESQDPRDKVYGLLGMYAQFDSRHCADLSLAVDYSKPVDAVYLDFASAIAHYHRDLRILVEAGIPRNMTNESVLDLPSWVPDLRTCALQSGELLHDATTNAGGEITDHDWTIDGRILKCHGLVVGEILGTSHVEFDDSFDVDAKLASNREREYMHRYLRNRAMMCEILQTFLLHWAGRDKKTQTATAKRRTFWEHAVAWSALNDPAYLRALEHKQGALMSSADAIQRYSSHDPYFPRFRLWLVRILIQIGIDSATMHAEQLERLSRLNLPPPTLNLTAKQIEWSLLLFVRSIKPRLQQRVWFGTRTGFLGNGPTLTRSGDVLCVIFGCSVPMILRPRENGTYLVIGRCFVASLMRGEAVEKWRVSGEPCRAFTLV